MTATLMVKNQEKLDLFRSKTLHENIASLDVVDTKNHSCRNCTNSNSQNQRLV